MARKDAYHDIVKNALEKDGWTITHDPLHLEMGGVRINIDLGAEQQPIAAEKDGEKIAVEIKSFVGGSDINELEKAIGQYLLYSIVLANEEPDRKLYLAVPETAYYGIFSEQAVILLVKNQNVRLIIFDEFEGRIIQWIDEKNTKKSSNN
ncbi:fatty-acid synthase [Candidatus Poribacteria bacterium]|nr:fatty-acid synthase [Candidatus Poribacteria bacterium]